MAHRDRTRRSVPPRAIDLFCGAGGLTQGLKQAGFKVVAAIENDPLAVETYGRNHPEVFIHANDILKTTVSSIMRAVKIRRGELDLLAGCPPCQAFSNLRSLNGKRKVRDRSKNLIYEFMRFVRQLRPKTVMLENVPRLLRDRRLRDVRNELEQLGYRTICEVLDAADYGVPQRRRRMILLGSRIGNIEFGPSVMTRKTVRQAIARIRYRDGDPLQTIAENRSSRIRDLIRSIPLDGGSRTSLSKRKQLKCHGRCDGFKDIYGRMAWDEVAPTLTSGCINPSKGRFLHPVKHRAITLREAALLQTFPINYNFSLKRGRYAVARMIGNALPPEFIRRHALTLKRSLYSKSHGILGYHDKLRKRRPTEQVQS